MAFWAITVQAKMEKMPSVTIIALPSSVALSHRNGKSDFAKIKNESCMSKCSTGASGFANGVTPEPQMVKGFPTVLELFFYGGRTGAEKEPPGARVGTDAEKSLSEVLQ